MHCTHTPTRDGDPWVHAAPISFYSSFLSFGQPKYKQQNNITSRKRTVLPGLVQPGSQCCNSSLFAFKNLDIAFSFSFPFHHHHPTQYSSSFFFSCVVLAPLLCHSLQLYVLSPVFFVPYHPKRTHALSFRPLHVCKHNYQVMFICYILPSQGSQQ